MVSLQSACIFLIITVDFLNCDMSSYITFQNQGTDFIPINARQFITVVSSIQSKHDCSFLCHENPSCRTFVFDTSTCRLYEGSIDTGQVVFTSSSSSIVGAIDYTRINLSSAFNQSCEYCYPDRYLVCQNGRCQCPSNTYWNEKDKCLNQQFVQSALSCEMNSWCREDMNLTCVCTKCQCPVQTFWNNVSCIPQFLQNAPCNTSDQCRNDLQLVCSRINKTCSAVSPMLVNVTNAIMPEKFLILNITLLWAGNEWWQAFDDNLNTIWNAATSSAPNYMYLILNDDYLLTSMQLTAYGDVTHDPKLIELYLDENATCLAANFSYPQAPNATHAFPANSLMTFDRPIVAQRLLLDIAERWSIYQTWLPELKIYGIPY